jgi:Aerotolerance regulator N-terminal/von Willebrand factor type A domain
MGFLAPVFLAGLAAVAVPILLHLFRREIAPPVPFTAVRFLEKRTIERQERRRIQDPWLLLLRVAALALLALAFARPYLTAEATTRPPVVLAVDVSYSMGAPGRLEAARSAATGALADLSGDTPVGLVSFADRATVLAEPTTDHGAVRVQLAALQAGHGATRYAGPLEAARGLFDGRPGRVVLVTDLQARGWARGTTSLPDNVRLDVLGVGARVDNVLVRDLVVTRQQARVVVSNAGQVPVRGSVSLAREGVAPVSQAFALDAGVSRDFVFAGPHAGGAYVARITDTVGFSADNERHAVLRDQAATTVQVIVGDDVERSRALFVERAFAALGSEPGSAYAVRVVAGTAALGREALRGADLVFWLSATGVDRRAVTTIEQFVRDGGRVVVACGPALDPRVADVVTRPFGITLAGRDGRVSSPGGLVAQDPRHPLIAGLGEARQDLARTTTSQACDMNVSGAASMIARFGDGGPALAEARAGSGHLLVFASDLGRQWNNLPVQAAFVPVVGELAQYLLGDAAAARVALANVEDPRYARPGVWPVGPRGQAAAVNVDVSESDQSFIPTDEFQQAIARPPADEARVARVQAARLEHDQSWWRYGIALLGMTLVVESLIARRARAAEVVS